MPLSFHDASTGLYRVRFKVLDVNRAFLGQGRRGGVHVVALDI